MAFNADDWRDDVDRSIDGVFKSFWAAALSAPPALLASVTAQRAVDAMPIEDRGEALSLPWAALAATQFLSLAIIWALSLGLILATARQTGASRQSAETIIAYNWSQLLGFMIFLLPVLTFLTTKSADAYLLAVAPVALLNLFILWRILRSVVLLTAGVAVGLVISLIIIELIADMAIFNIVATLFQALS